MATVDAPNGAEPVPHTPASYRVALGLTRAEWASRADPNVSVDTVAACERGDDIGVRAVRALAGPLGIEPGVLLAAMDRVRAVRS